MQTCDQFDQIGTKLLLSDVDLALTTIRIALSRPPGQSRAIAIAHAKTAYQRICELVCQVQMDRDDLLTLGAQLEKVRAAIEQANGIAVPNQA